MGQNQETHVLLVPYPNQGHINPILQFAKRLASHGIRTSLATTRFNIASTRPEPGPVSIEPFSDGFDQDGFMGAAGVEDYTARLESVGSETLAELLESLRSKGNPVHVLVYDGFCPWVCEVGLRFGLRTACFFTEACTVDAIYWGVRTGRVQYPVTGPVEVAPGLPVFEPRDVPSFLSDTDRGPYPAFLGVLLDQYKNLDKADVLLINSFYELEPEAFNWMRSSWRVKSIGPTVPSAYTDNRISWDTQYGLDLYPPDSQPYLSWLDSKPPASVVYISFGSKASLVSLDQMTELALTLASTKYSFLWIVHTSELPKLPEDFVERTRGRGLVVTWCNQVDTLANDAVGSFVTHCGWNSTLEGIALGVPMVAMPQWTDQITNAMLVEEVWGIGVRVEAKDGSGIVRREELESGIGEVMEGKRSEEIRSNAVKWKNLLKAAISDGGSSDDNIVEFIAECCR